MYSDLQLDLPLQDEDFIETPVLISPQVPPLKDVLETPVLNLKRPPAAPHPKLFPQTYLELMRRSEQRLLEKMNWDMDAWEEEPEIVRPMFESYGRKNVPILVDTLDDPKPNWLRMWEARKEQEHRRWLNQQRMKVEDEWAFTDLGPPPEPKEEPPTIEMLDIMDFRPNEDCTQTESSSSMLTTMGSAAAWGASTFSNASVATFGGTPSSTATGTLAAGTSPHGKRPNQLAKHGPGFVIGGGRGLSSSIGQRGSLRRPAAPPGPLHVPKQRTSPAMTAPDGQLHRSSSAAATRSGSRGNFPEQARPRLSGSPSASRRSGLRPRKGEPLEPLGPGSRPVPGPGGRH